MPHFEIHVTDVGRAKAFYGGLFGWSFEPMPGGEEVDYTLVSGIGEATTMTAALMRRQDATPKSGSPIRGGTMVFEVDDCDSRYDWAMKNGGAEALPPMDYPGVGRCAYVEDGEGNVVGMIKPEGGA
ncbi:VOC family protein [Pseudooceanicola sp.]|uniref:VOC family protein n=1 Tax=Pseudooceanicola sp. TaxID=1914328 RepID=UPI0035C689B2